MCINKRAERGVISEQGGYGKFVNSIKYSSKQARNKKF